MAVTGGLLPCYRRAWRLAGIVWELLVLAMPQNQPRRKRWTGEHAWTSGLLRASLATEKKGSVLET